MLALPLACLLVTRHATLHTPSVTVDMKIVIGRMSVVLTKISSDQCSLEISTKCQHMLACHAASSICNRANENRHWEHVCSTHKDILGPTSFCNHYHIAAYERGFERQHLAKGLIAYAHMCGSIEGLAMHMWSRSPLSPNPLLEPLRIVARPLAGALNSSFEKYDSELK